MITEKSESSQDYVNDVRQTVEADNEQDHDSYFLALQSLTNTPKKFIPSI